MRESSDSRIFIPMLAHLGVGHILTSNWYTQCHPFLDGFTF